MRGIALLQSQLGPLDHPRQCRFDRNTVLRIRRCHKIQDSSGDGPKNSGAEEKCISPPPLFDVNEFPGPIKKRQLLSRKLERKTVPQPPRRSGTTICALEPHERFALFVSDSFDPVSFASKTFSTGWAQFGTMSQNSARA